ncbi:MAG: cryptochrome/photolyase family protein, partial [Gemmobacter sp.]
MTDAPLIWWVRRDLRLADNPCLAALAAAGRPVVPVAILDPETEALGAAPKWRLGEGWRAFAATLAGIGTRLVFRRGPALAVLAGLVAETGAAGVHWSRLYDPVSVARDTAVKAALKAQGIAAVSHGGHLLREPWEVATGQGGFYKVYTPYWRAASALDVPPPVPRVTALRPAPSPPSDRLEDWGMGAAMHRGAGIVARHAAVGEAAAEARLADFLGRAADYARLRDRPDLPGTSRLSENLAVGEIGIRTVWHAAFAAVQRGTGTETFLKELVWREFAYHLAHHTPHIVSGNWKPEWDAFPWQDANPAAEAWTRGMTGVPFVDAGMREMYVTGTMHNRARMIVASYLTKHLMTHWRFGADWFADCLIDWDPASNAMGWQWAAGSGPDAAPYFRVFNPETQAAKFDPEGAYRRRWIAELSTRPGPDALAFFDAVPQAWALRPDAPYPAPALSLAEGRARALAAYGARNS